MITKLQEIQKEIPQAPGAPNPQRTRSSIPCIPFPCMPVCPDAPRKEGNGCRVRTTADQDRASVVGRGFHTRVENLGVILTDSDQVEHNAAITFMNLLMKK